MNFGGTNNNSNLIPVIGAITVALIIGGFLISLLTPSAFPVAASAEAEQVDTLFRVMLGIGGGIFLLVQGLLVYSVIRFRKRKGDEADGPTIHGNTTLEMVWTAIPAVVVLVLVIYSYQVWVDIQAPKDNELTVYATGARYAWTFEYDDERVEQTISSPILHTYVGRPVRMEMQTEDVIHSFWVPTMRIKQDLLPGRTTEVRFTPTEAGEYRVVCTELCGAGHGQMYASIVVHEDEEAYLASFVDPAVDTILNPPEDPVVRGGALLASGAYPCAGCHVLQEDVEGGLTIDWAGVTGPALEGVGDRADDRVAGQAAEEYLYISLYDTDSYLVPGYGNLMNQFQKDDPSAPNYMPPEDAHAIVAYLCQLTDTGDSNCDLENLEAFSESYIP